MKLHIMQIILSRLIRYFLVKFQSQVYKTYYSGYILLNSLWTVAQTARRLIF